MLRQGLQRGVLRCVYASLPAFNLDAVGQVVLLSWNVTVPVVYFVLSQEYTVEVCVIISV